MNDRNSVAECHFLDVGQGTSNVILLGDRRGIVIDCGVSGRVPLQLLRRYVDQVVALIVSHNDRDHHGGAAAIIAAYPNAIDRVYFLQDRPVERIRLYAVVRRALEEGSLDTPPVRLERDDTPRVLFSDPTKGLSVELFFPTFQDNLDAQDAVQPNETSAVLVLFCGKRKLVYPGDASIGDWRRIRDRLNGPITADIVGVPHHGGNITERQQRGESAAEYEARVQQDLRWLYAEAVRCKFAVVSVGTSNPYGHPKRAVVSALTASGACVVCTQITRQCHDDLEQLRPGVRRPDYPSQSRGGRDLTSGGRSRNVACAGTVISEVGPESVIIHRFDDHQHGVDGLMTSAIGHPLCR
ncbi:MAG: MBL fold metallo-hydrolase [Planctomycetes bacterium]|nr:MBL fold metallo-hydrolase [Planctomycetota bacterium]